MSITENRAKIIKEKNKTRTKTDKMLQQPVRWCLNNNINWVGREYTEISLIRQLPDLLYGVGSRNWVRGAWSWKLRSRSWGAYQNVRVGKIASAEGAKLRLLKAKCSSRLEGLGSVVSSPSGVWCRAPETDAILSISCKNWIHFGFL